MPKGIYDRSKAKPRRTRRGAARRTAPAAPPVAASEAPPHKAARPADGVAEAVGQELTAMHEIVKALRPLSTPAQRAVLRWAVERFGAAEE